MKGIESLDQFELVELDENEKILIQGGNVPAPPADGLTAAAAVYFSAVGLVCVSLGPVGWPAAIIAGAAGLYLGTQAK
ncbi:MAG TPA: hypothetical protein VIM65_13685 [Cyclobacteriaceae bacterium]